jgi:hypothetical protein
MQNTALAMQVNTTSKFPNTMHEILQNKLRFRTLDQAFGLPQAFGPAAPLCPRRRRHGSVQKKSTPPSWKETAALKAEGKDIEIWFQDEARKGQKNKITRRWDKRLTRPSAPHDQRTHSVYIFGAICPKEGKSAAPVLPRFNSETMSRHLREISRAVKQGAHAVVIFDHDGWHGSKRLHVPDNSLSCRCCHNPPSRTRSRTYGNSSATPGSQTGSSSPTRISSTTAAMPGTNSPTSHGRSSASELANELMSDRQCELIFNPPFTESHPWVPFWIAETSSAMTKRHANIFISAVSF